MSSYKWEHMDSNQGPSACKADALNQLSYAPNILMNGWRFSAKDPPDVKSGCSEPAELCSR